MSLDMRKSAKVLRNWTGPLDNSTKFDFPEYNQGPGFKNDKITDVHLKQVFTLQNLETRSPRLLELAENIFRLDTKDVAKHGHKFKHFIFSDSPNDYGAKLIASALQSVLQLKPIMEIGVKSGSSGSPVVRVGEGGTNYYGLLTPARILKTEYISSFKSDMLKKYNAPENVNGRYMRFIILDKAYKEGIDLKNVRYVHLFEPLPTYAQEKQAVARAIRFCSHKNMYFVPDRGWKVDVHVYKLYTPENVVVDIWNPETKTYEKRKNVDVDALIQQLGTSAASQYTAKFVDFVEAVGPTLAVDFYLTRKLIPKPTNLQPWLQGQVDAAYDAVAEPGANLAGYVLKTFPKSVIPDPEVMNNCLFLETYLTRFQKYLGDFIRSDQSRLGMLLWHSPGSGKTCTAMHMAKMLCRDGYDLNKVCWATTWALGNAETQCTLKDSKIYIPHPNKKKKEEAQDSWMGLIYSYLRLKTYLKNEMEAKHNLDGVVIVIDEAHLLFSNELQVNEILSPDEQKLLREAIVYFWTHPKKAERPLRVILLTGTPVAQPKYLFKLLNLVRDPTEAKLPEKLEEIQARYGSDPNNFDLAKLASDTEGYISYLDTKMDVSRFAKRTPLIEHRVEMSMRDTGADDIRLVDTTKKVEIAEMKMKATLKNYLNSPDPVESDFLKAIRVEGKAYFETKARLDELTKRKTRKKMSLEQSQETAFRKCKLLNDGEIDLELKELQAKRLNEESDVSLSEPPQVAASVPSKKPAPRKKKAPAATRKKKSAVLQKKLESVTE